MLRRSILVALTLTIGACGDDTSPPSTIEPSTTTSVANPSPTTFTETTTTVTNNPPGTTSTTTSVPFTDPVIQIVVTITAGEISVVVSGELVEGRVSIDLGSELRIEVIADTDDEVHAHGYDETASVGPTGAAVIEISADIPGIFDVELEGAHLLLLQLEVS